MWLNKITGFKPKNHLSAVEIFLLEKWLYLLINEKNISWFKMSNTNILMFKLMFKTNIFYLKWMGDGPWRKW